MTPIDRYDWDVKDYWPQTRYPLRLLCDYGRKAPTPTKGRVYLAGPIGNLTYDAVTGWREELTRRFAAVGIEALSPLRGKGYLNAMSVMPSHIPDNSRPLSTARGINVRDRWDAARCDVMLVNLRGATTPSFGTVLEIGYAIGADPFKPVVLVIEPDNIHNHAMLLECAGYIVESLEEAEEVVCAILNVEQHSGY